MVDGAIDMVYLDAWRCDLLRGGDETDRMSVMFVWTDAVPHTPRSRTNTAKADRPHVLSPAQALLNLNLSSCA